MSEEFSRTELLLGAPALERLKNSRVAIFGVGGVGGYVTEALARTGIGTLDLIDMDTVSVSNINRQIIAAHSTIGRSKVDVMKERILDINPHAVVNTYFQFYLPECEDDFPFAQYDYIVDAVDTVTAKLSLAEKSYKMNIPIISSMGAGNKLDPTRFQVADIYDTKVCPLAKVMRRELKKRNVPSLKVVYSQEEPLTPLAPQTSFEETPTVESTEKPAVLTKRRSTPGSVAFVPSVVGLIVAGEVIKDLLK